MNTALFADNITKTYVLPHKKVDVLKGASFSVEKGEKVAIVGKSGSGKSTLLHLLGGLDSPDAGTVFHGDVDLYKLSPRLRSEHRAKNLGFVFQAYHLLPEMDIVENVMLPAMALGTVKHPRKRAEELLDAVGLKDRLTHTPMELSGGEQQRVALARAMMNNPKLLLADEPTGNLDSATGATVLDLLFQMSEGHALIMVTHSKDIAARCDRVVVLENGQLKNSEP